MMCADAVPVVVHDGFSAAGWECRRSEGDLEKSPSLKNDHWGKMADAAPVKAHGAVRSS
jgi:hypothetical protein